MPEKKILIVEDEVIIAHDLKETLEAYGYTCAGIVISVDKALRHLEKERVDLVLLDINLYGEKTGLDLAKLLFENYDIPFIYLTSYEDPETIKKIKETKPAGYLQKPTSDVMLTTTIDLVLEANEPAPVRTFRFTVQGTEYNIHPEEILYAKADHVYVELYLTTETIVLRSSLRKLLEVFPDTYLVRLNRGIAVNPSKIFKIEKRKAHIDGQVFVISPRHLETIAQYM